jgi:glycosyltransferase involved in cell wall biosynthesis
MDVSIVITSYNYVRFIDECLDSCLNQKGAALKYEVIVVDDGSTDETPAALTRRVDPRLRVLRIENSGIELAANRGFEAALGRYIVRVDADDALEPNYLAQIAPFLQKDFGFCYADYTVIDGDSVPKEIVSLPDFDKSEIMTRGDFLATGTLYPTALLRTLGGYDTLTRNSGLENYELIIRIMSKGATGIHVAVPLFRYRRHDTNMSTKRIDNIIANGRALFERYGLGGFRTNENHPYRLVLSEHLK